MSDALDQRAAKLGMLRHEVFPDLALVFTPAVCHAVALQERGPQLAKPKRIARGLSARDKVRALVEKAGSNGTTTTAIVRAIRPRVPTEVVRAMLGELAGSGAIRRVEAGGRAGMRYFGNIVAEV